MSPHGSPTCRTSRSTSPSSSSERCAGILIPPYFENFGKRLIKSPKLYFVDSGLACHLLGIVSEPELARSPFLGPIFEGFLAAEIWKEQVSSGRRREIYYFRDQQGLEVDFVVPGSGGSLLLVEAKASRTAVPADAEPIARLSRAIRRKVQGYVVHRPVADGDALTVLRPGVKALSVTVGFLEGVRAMRRELSSISVEFHAPASEGR